MEDRLIINRDGSEQLAYQNPDFPVHVFDDYLSRLANFDCGCHWHEDFELVIVRQGEMDYFVNGQVLHLTPGQGVFANSRRLHHGFSSTHQECLYYGMTFHPSVLGQLPLPMARYAMTLAEDGQEDCLLLDPANEADRQIAAQVDQILALAKEQPELYELTVQGLCGGILRLLWSRMLVDARKEQADPAWAALRKMVGYIQDHYREPMTLEEIAAAGAVCRSKCCKLFRERMNCTPIGYANRYRLERAAQLLRNSPLSITEISQQCGFDSPSYFADSFRRAFGATPRIFRRKDGNQRTDR